VVGDGILDDFEKLFLRVCGSNRQSMKELDHEACESFECSWNANCRADFDEDPFGCVDVDLQLASLVDWRVEKGEEALDLGVRSVRISGDWPVV